MTSSVAASLDSAPRRSSIILHPWFPKVVGLWFAALFGLCSLAVASDVLESVVTMLGIDRIVPAAAPPLGQTARLLLAMGMAGIGEIVGLVIGARLATSRQPQPVRQRTVKSTGHDDAQSDAAPQVRDKDRHPDAPPRKPLSAVYDLRGIDNALRRRALASEADLDPRPFIEVAPLPGGEWPTAAPAVSDAEAVAVAEDPQPEESMAIGALDLAIYDSPVEHEALAGPAHSFAPFSAPGEPDAAPVTAPEPDVAPLAMQLPATSAVAIASASLEALGVVQLSERLALALQARRERLAQPVASVPVVSPVAVMALAEVAPEAGEALAPVPEMPVFAPPVAFDPPPAAAIAGLPGLHLSYAEHVDDIEEAYQIPALARSLAMPARSPEPVEEPADILPELERGLEILARRAARATPEAEMPASETVQPDTAGDEVRDPAPFAGADQDVAETADDCGDGDDLDELADEAAQSGYSSLLAMGSGVSRAEAVRIEEPESDEIEPVVIFPGQGARTMGQAPAPFSTPFEQPGPAAMGDFAAPVAGQAPGSSGPLPQADPEETDRALRAALASLQRISGAR